MHHSLYRPPSMLQTNENICLESLEAREALQLGLNCKRKQPCLTYSESHLRFLKCCIVAFHLVGTSSSTVLFENNRQNLFFLLLFDVSVYLFKTTFRTAKFLQGLKIVYVWPKSVRGSSLHM